MKKRQVEAARQWLVTAAKNARGIDSNPQLGGVLSTLTCAGRSEAIEPLTGIARHPFANVGCFPESSSVDLFNLSYLVLKSACPKSAVDRFVRGEKRLAKGRGTRALLYDLGTSWYNGTLGLAKWSTPGVGLGPSIPSLTSMYARRCIDFDSIWAWECVLTRPSNPQTRDVLP